MGKKTVRYSKTRGILSIYIYIDKYVSVCVCVYDKKKTNESRWKMMGNSETWKWWLRKGHIYKTYRIYQQDLGWGEEKVKEVFAFPRFSGIEQCFLNLTNPKNHLDQKLSFGGLKTKVLPLSLTQNRWLVTKQWKTKCK